MQLNSKQTEMLDRAAALLPSSQQHGFKLSVEGVLSSLLNFPPTDAQLKDTLRFVLAGRGVSVGDLSPPRPRKICPDRSANNWPSWHRPKTAPREIER